MTDTNENKPLELEFPDRLRKLLKERSAGEQNTWVFVAMFMDMIDEVEKDLISEAEPEPTISKKETVDYDMSIHSNPDHNAWAKFFIESWPNGCSDEETMAGWFANAMMAKHDSMASSEMEHTTKSADESQWLPEVGKDYELKPYWHKVRVVAHEEVDGMTRIVFWDCHDLVYDYLTNLGSFRPIQPEQTEREKFIEKAAYEAYSASGCSHDGEFFGAIYDWLSSEGMLTKKDGSHD